MLINFRLNKEIPGEKFLLFSSTVTNSESLPVSDASHIQLGPSQMPSAIYKLALAMGTCHGHLPSASTRAGSSAAAVAASQHSLKGVQDRQQK